MKDLYFCVTKTQPFVQLLAAYLSHKTVAHFLSLNIATSEKSWPWWLQNFFVVTIKHRSDSQFQQALKKKCKRIIFENGSYQQFDQQLHDGNIDHTHFINFKKFLLL